MLLFMQTVINQYFDTVQTHNFILLVVRCMVPTKNIQKLSCSLLHDRYYGRLGANEKKVSRKTTTDYTHIILYFSLRESQKSMKLWADS